jgi:Leucine-rich repeat (LRR) protein
MMEYYNRGDATSNFKDVERLINSNPITEFIEISTFFFLQRISADIGNLKNLSQLIISSCPKLEELPPELTQIKSLRSLSVKYSQHKNLLPGLSTLVQLRKLSLKGQHYSQKTNWKLLESLRGIESLELSNSLIALKGNLPKEIFSLEKLQFLYLDNNRLNKLPFEIGRLKELLMLDLGYNVFSDFPDELLLLPKLETLIINAEAIDCVPFELFELPALRELKITGRNAKQYSKLTHVERFFYTSKRKKFDRGFINLVLTVIKYPNLLEELELSELMLLLNCEIEPIVFKSLEKLESILQNAYSPLSSASVLLIGGKTFENKGILKSKLEHLGIKTSSKFTSKVTHVLLTTAMKVSDLNVKNEVVFLTENMLMKEIYDSEVDILSVETADYVHNLDKVRQLLNSEDVNNNLIAINLLTNTNLIEDLLTDLLFLYKKSGSQLIRKACLDLLKKQGKLDFAIDLKKRMPLFSVVKESTLSKSLLFYSSKYKLDMSRLLKMIFDKTKMGKNFALMHFDSKEKIEFFEKMIDGGHLNLSRIDLEKLPEDFGIFSDKVELLDLSHNNFIEFPIEGLLKLKKLTGLKFINANIWHYPDEIAELSQLDVIFLPVGFSQIASSELKSILKKRGVIIIPAMI